MKLKDIIYNYRKTAKLTQKQFAQRCGLSHSYVSFLENGTNTRGQGEIAPTIQTLEKLANAMSLELNELIKMIEPDIKIREGKNERELAQRIAQLKPEQQENVRQFVDFLLTQDR